MTHFLLALEEINPQNEQFNLGKIHTNLASIYIHRIRGDRSDNIDQAINHLNQALKTYRQDSFPEAWAHTQNNLGVCYILRENGERGKNLEKGLFHLSEALKVFTRKDFPKEWEGIQINLASLTGVKP
jgi:tetratricopeptide (TPR) repeat protein